MANLQDKVSKLETMAGIEPKKNSFENNKSFAFTPEDWTSIEFFRFRMGDKSLEKKYLKTNWNGFTGSIFLEQLSYEELSELENKLSEELQMNLK